MDTYIVNVAVNQYQLVNGNAQSEQIYADFESAKKALDCDDASDEDASPVNWES